MTDNGTRLTFIGKFRAIILMMNGSWVVGLGTLVIGI